MAKPTVGLLLLLLPEFAAALHGILQPCRAGGRAWTFMSIEPEPSPKDAGAVDTKGEEVDEKGLSRRDLLRLGLYVGWAYGAGTSVGHLLDFPPASFKALAREVYLDAQTGVQTSGGRPLRVLEIGTGTGLASVFDDRFVAGSEVLGIDVDAPGAATLV